MKSRLLFLALVCLMTQSAIAQPVVGAVTKAIPKVDLGIKAGGNFEQLSGSPGDGYTWQHAYKPGIVAGVFGGLRKNNIGGQIEVLFNTAQYPLNSISAGSSTFKTTKIDVPVLFQYKIIPFIWLQVGPQYSSYISVTNSSFNGDVKKVFSSSDVAGVLGLEAKLPVKLNVGARYLLGLSNVNHNYQGLSGAWNTRTIQVYVGFRFI
jgi:Outer membrane protein beta-barrel domain